ncbi:MAG: hypothetical protein IJX91_02490 [Clostridia bacterium]|nr:hypothetical protein [Clostridia bacterium]
MEQEKERRLLTRADCLERLRECWEEADLKKGELTQAGKELIELNLSIIQTWERIEETDECKDHVDVIGFHYDESDEEDEDEDNESEEDE